MEIHISEDFSEFKVLNELNQEELLNILKLGLEVKSLIQEKYNTPNAVKHALSKDDIVQNEIAEVNINIATLTSEVYRITSLLGSGTRKGRVAETILFDNLRKYFPDAEINDTGYKYGKGDVYIYYRNYNIMIEIKNYCRNVPRKEKEKFQRDLMQNNYHAGILMSCNAGIVQCRNNMEVNTINDKISIYLSNTGTGSESIMWAILFIVTFLQNMSENNRQNKNTVTNYVKNKLINIEECVKAISSMSEALCNLKSDINKVINNNISKLNISINLTRQRLESMILSFQYILNTGELLDCDTVCVELPYKPKYSSQNNDMNNDMNKSPELLLLESMTVFAIRKKAKELGIDHKGKKQDIINRLLQQDVQ